MFKSLAPVALVLAGLLTTSGAAHAQSSITKSPGFELIVPSGTVVPTGAQEDDMKRSSLTAVQVSYGLRPDLVLTSTSGWARTSTLGQGRQGKLDLFTYDGGVEYRLPRRTADRRINFKPFAGAGIGARTHNYRDAATATTHNLATYASAGGELGVARVRVRVEVRDYLTWVTPLGSADSARRNDVAVLAGLRLALRSHR